MMIATLAVIGYAFLCILVRHILIRVFGKNPENIIIEIMVEGLGIILWPIILPMNIFAMGLFWVDKQVAKLFGNDKKSKVKD